MGEVSPVSNGLGIHAEGPDQIDCVVHPPQIFYCLLEVGDGSVILAVQPREPHVVKRSHQPIVPEEGCND